MDFGSFSRDLRQGSSNTDMGFGGFHFSSDLTPPITNPFLNQNLNASALMTDNDLCLVQNLRKMSISDEQSSIFTGSSQFLNHSGFLGSRNLYGFSRFDQPRDGLEQSSHGKASMRGYGEDLRARCEGLVQSYHGEASMRGYGDFHRLDQDLRVRREGLIQRSNGDSSMSGYVGDGDYHRLRLLGVQDYPNPNPSFNHRGFTENNMSLHNRDYLLERMNPQIRRDISLIPQNFPPFSEMGDSQEREASTKSMKKNSSFDRNGDLTLHLASIVDIYGSVYSMAKDQLGCRFLQKLVEEGSFVDVMIIYNEVINHVIELGMDQFGNYFIQKLLQVCNEEQRTQILIKLTSKPGLLVKISINTFGTRVVQKLIETMSTKEQSSLVKSALQPRLLSLITELNGNHVILSCLKSFGPNDNKFILEAATKFCAEIAIHRHGCCVLQSCVFYSVGEHRKKLIDEISRNSLQLAQDPFGNYVVQFIIEKKVGRVNVMFELRGNYVKLATQKFGSHVVEKCLRFYPESRSQIVHELVSVPNFEDLLQDPYANYVIQSALSVTKGFVRSSLVEKVRRCGNLRTSPYCKKIFSKNILKK